MHACLNCDGSWNRVCTRFAPKGKTYLYIYIVGNVGNSPSAFPHPPRHDLGSWMHLERRVDTCCSKLELGYYQLPRCTFYAVWCACIAMHTCWKAEILTFRPRALSCIDWHAFAVACHTAARTAMLLVCWFWTRTRVAPGGILMANKQGAAAFKSLYYRQLPRWDCFHDMLAWRCPSALTKECISALKKTRAFEVEHWVQR